MAIPRPAKGFRWLLTQTAAYDILIAVFAAAIGFSSADNYYSQGRIRLANVVGLSTVFVVIFTVLKQVVTLSAARARISTHELEGCLYEAYVSELVSDWNYPEERARTLNPGAMEWMALPVYDADRQRVDAVLFLEPSQRGFFTPERQEVVLAALSGIAVYVGKRYA